MVATSFETASFEVLRNNYPHTHSPPITDCIIKSTRVLKGGNALSIVTPEGI